MARMIELTTPLGTDVLLFRALHGREELGRLVGVRPLGACRPGPTSSPSDLLGKSVTVKLELRERRRTATSTATSPASPRGAWSGATTSTA